MTPIETNTFYRHYKGDIYRVDAIAKDEETKELRVIYTDIKGETWDRKLSVWNQQVDGQPRFALVEKQCETFYEFEKARIKR